MSLKNKQIEKNINIKKKQIKNRFYANLTAQIASNSHSQ